MKYKIVDPLKFLQSVGDEDNLVTKLDPVLKSSLRKVISEVPLSTLLTHNRTKLMTDIKKFVNQSGKAFGIEVIDVRISRADFPEKNRFEIYARMSSDRKKEASDLRAKGAEEATKIRAMAERDRTILMAEARKQSEILRGEGDGEATKIYNKAYSQDPDFFNFYRTMQAYKEALKKEDTTVILSPDSEFLKYFRQSGN